MTVLTPALSSEEREKRFQPLWKNQRQDWPDGQPTKQKSWLAVPLPGGEGQAEGGR